MDENNHLCQYSDKSGCQCREPDNGSGFCYWHDKDVDKSGDDVCSKLEQYARSGGLLRGICLKRANLANIGFGQSPSKTRL